MPKSQQESPELDEQLLQELTAMDQEQQFHILATILEQFAGRLDTQGVAEEALDSALLEVFVARLATRGDRQRHDDLLVSALEAEWDLQTLH